MNLLIATDNYPPYIGGVARLMETVCHSFPPESLRVIAPSCPGDVEMDAQSPYRVQRIKSRSRLPMGLRRKVDTLICMVRFARVVLASVRREAPSFVLFNSVWPTGLLGPVLRRRGVPCAIFAHGLEVRTPRPWPLDALRRRALQSADYVICNSRFCRQTVLEQGVDERRAVINHPAIDPLRFQEPPDLDAFREREDLAGHAVLLTVSWLGPVKGIDRVIRALPKVLEEFPETLYVVVGEREPARPGFADELARLAASLGVADHVRFVGNRDVVKFMHACDVYVMPSIYNPSKLLFESFGITFLEANACRKPVIGGRSAGMLDAVAEGESGLLVDSDDIDALAEAALALLRDPELRRRLGAQGYERVLREFTLERFRRNLSKLFDVPERQPGTQDDRLEESLSRTDGD